MDGLLIFGDMSMLLVIVVDRSSKPGSGGWFQVVCWIDPDGQRGRGRGAQTCCLTATCLSRLPPSPLKHNGIIAGNLRGATLGPLNWHQSGGYCTMKVCHPNYKHGIIAVGRRGSF